MRSQQHEIPTHLNVEDKLLFGLTARQFLYVLVGSTLAYGLWEQIAAAPSALRIGATAACLLVAAAVTLLRPLGRALEEWLLAGLIYLSRPRRSVWQVREQSAAEWRPAVAGWQELAPNLIWTEDEDT
jgi:hypothetical protein